MEGLQPIYRRVAGIDVHRMLHVVTVVIEQSDGGIELRSREFGGFQRDCRALSVWLTEIGDAMTRFGAPDRLAAWAALCPGNNESAGKRKSGKTRKGNAIIRYILCECANAARMTKSSLAAKYKSLMVRKRHKKSIVAIAHKMIRLIYLMLTRKEPYRDPMVDYDAMSAKKNAPRWIRQLKLIGQWPGKTAAPASA
jgi:transposase